MLGWWRKRSERHRANKQQGDPHALDVEGDPRGGVQSDAYRSAEPTELVEEDGGEREGSSQRRTLRRRLEEVGAPSS